MVSFLKELNPLTVFNGLIGLLVAISGVFGGYQIAQLKLSKEHTKLHGEHDAMTKQLRGEHDAMTKQLHGEHDAMTKQLHGEHDAMTNKSTGEHTNLLTVLGDVKEKTTFLEKEATVTKTLREQPYGKAVDAQNMATTLLGICKELTDLRISNALMQAENHKLQEQVATLSQKNRRLEQQLEHPNSTMARGLQPVEPEPEDEGEEDTFDFER